MRKYIAGIAVASALMATSAKADVIDWTQWIGATPGTPGSAAGLLSDGPVTYAGEVQQLVANYPSWTPTSSYTGGTIGNAPPQSGGIIQMFGGANDTGIDTITFNAPVVDPVMAIWSLGQGSIDAQFDFINEPFTIEAGGPSAEYGGQSITSTGDTVFGMEGNGVIQFIGTYSSISWTNPVYEDWYGFTVGTDISAVPEPATWAMFLLGFGAIGWTLRSRRNASAATA
jgi:hypothetical protein